MPDKIDQTIIGNGNTFSGTGDVHVTHHHYPAPPPPTLSHKFDLSRLPTTDSTLFGREDELAVINEAWQDDGTNVLVLIAMGGAGKTALMQKWLDDEHWRDADAAYAWSFYDQGAAEDKQVSTAEFFDSALAWFGHDGSPIPSEHDRGSKLAELVCRQRTLLVLDGLEPLQHPLGGVLDGGLRDKGLVSLFKQLATANKGLLLLSSRQPLTELNGKPHLRQHELKPLTATAGIALFRAAQITGTHKELADTVEAYSGHALSLSLLAEYLRTYEQGDIRQRDTLSELTGFPEETRASRHAFKVMAAHEQKLIGKSDLQILLSLGLFDRPASAGAMSCLRQEGIIGLPKDERVFRAACERLRRQGLLNTARPEHPGSLDAHPLVRQYFGKRLAELHPESWRHAHLRLYEYFKAAAKELPDTLEEMEPLFAAVRHGCAAGLHQEIFDGIFWMRIRREQNDYLARKLGAFGAELAALSHFFTVPWQTPAQELTDDAKAIVLNWVGIDLRALGRLHEAVQPMQTGLTMRIQQGAWKNGGRAALSVSELHLLLGNIEQAIDIGRQGMQFADRTDSALWRIYLRIALADALHQTGDLNAAHVLFVEAEQLQQEREPKFAKLYSLAGFRYCDLLLTLGALPEVLERADYALNFVINVSKRLLDIALSKLSLGRAHLQTAINYSGLLTNSIFLINSQPAAGKRIGNILNCAKDWLDQATADFRAAGQEDYLPLGLLARAAWCRWAAVLLAQPAHLAAAEQDLQECEDIAQRGGIQLHLIDCHLEAARIALASGKAVLGLAAEEHLAAAQEGIAKTGYERRLAEAEQVAAMVQCQINPFAARQHPFSVKQQTSADR